MKELIINFKSNIASYSFKYIKDEIGTIVINKDNCMDYKELADILKEDKRKNVTSLGNSIENKIEKYVLETIRVKNMYSFDKSFGEYKYVAGVDEVGRGPLAGPIVACAVILDLNNLDDVILEINDSKVLSEAKREELSEIIKKKAISYCIAELSNEVIDEKGIAYCNNQIFIDSCKGLSENPNLVLSDGYLIKNFNIDNKSVIKGDTKSASIACASILAKVYRDKLMKEYSKQYPQYNFEKNVGYGTKAHVEAIVEYGVAPIHRKSFLNNILNL